MKALSILYHDVIENGDEDSSGFAGPAAARYKISRQDFEEHLEAISRVIEYPPATVFEIQSSSKHPRLKLLLTFDDGGVSALRVADMLTKRNWRGHFFVATDYVGKPAFLNAQQIRELRLQGHIIGSHSCSHPRRMSACSPEKLLLEWRQSIETLAEILAEPVTIASVPGGNYSDAVAQAAIKAGLKFLFTSEPSCRLYTIDGCCILGRYGVWRGTPPRAAADLVQHKALACFRQWTVWNLKKLLKGVGGNYYHQVRDLSLGEKIISSEQE